MVIDGEGMQLRGSRLVAADWTKTSSTGTGLQTWETRLVFDKGTVSAWIAKRPSYCDRGHYEANVDCTNNVMFLNLDGADGFPRYYMNETVARMEMTAWLNWRLFKIRGDE